MGQIDDMEVKLDWLVEAVRALLMREAGVEDYEGYLPTASYPDAPTVDEGVEWFAPIHQPKPVGPPPCNHNHQVLVAGNVQCAKCGFVLTRTGVRGVDPNSPIPAPGYEDQFNHVSSQNPGGALTPY